MGAHDDLMNRLGIYRRLYELQFAEADLKLAAPVPQS